MYPSRPWGIGTLTEVSALVDDAVEAGELTREQADAILAAQDADVLGGFGPRGHHGGPPVDFWGFPTARGLG